MITDLLQIAAHAVHLRCENYEIHVIDNVIVLSICSCGRMQRKIAFFRRLIQSLCQNPARTAAGTNYQNIRILRNRIV